MQKKGLVLVTGGSGYVGSILVPLLLDAGYSVRVLDVGFFGHEGLATVRDKIELIEKDIRDCTLGDLEGVTSVIHLAGFSNDPTAEFGPTDNYSINAGGTVHLAKLAKKVGVKRFLFGSTCSVYYSDVVTNEIKNEESHIDTRAPYSLSKYLAEIALLAEKSDDFLPIILRKGTVYGFSPRMRYDLVVNTFLKDIFTKGSLTLHHGGGMWRPLLDIKDAARAYIYFLEINKSELSDGIFNIISLNITIKDLAKKIETFLSREHGIAISIEGLDQLPESEIEKREKALRSYRVSGEKSIKVGFSPDPQLENSITEIWQHLKENHQKIAASSFYNISRFKEIADFKRAELGSLDDITYEIMYRTERDHWWYKVRREIVHDLLKIYLPKRNNNTTFLDIGCGTGLLLKEIEKEGIVYGVDVSEKVLSFCKERCPNAYVVLGRGDQLPFPDNHFDVVFALDALHRTKDDEKILTETYRVLKSNGLLIVFVPTFPILKGISDVVGKYLRRYRLKGLEEKIIQAKYIILKKSYFNVILFLPILIIRLLYRILKVPPDLKYESLEVGFINKILYYLFHFESKLLKYINFPFGVSGLIVAKKTNVHNA